MGGQVTAHGGNDPRFEIYIGPANRLDLVDAREKMGRFQKLDRRAVIHGPLRVLVLEGSRRRSVEFFPSYHHREFPCDRKDASAPHRCGRGLDEGNHERTETDRAIAIARDCDQRVSQSIAVRRPGIKRAELVMLWRFVTVALRAAQSFGDDATSLPST